MNHFSGRSLRRPAHVEAKRSSGRCRATPSPYKHRKTHKSDSSLKLVDTLPLIPACQPGDDHVAQTSHPELRTLDHGRRTGRLRLRLQDGVCRRQRLWRSCGQDEDPPAGQRDCRFVTLARPATFPAADLVPKVPIISTATTYSALLNHEVYLTDRLDNQSREKMRHLRCLCFVRPSPDSVQLLIDELREPKYGEYILYFSNIIRKSSLERLAEADDHEVVRTVQEYFADYLVINPDLMSLNVSFPKHRLWSNSPDIWNADSLQRTTEGLLALLLSLKKKPLIRYAKNSLLAVKLAREVRYQMTQEDQLFEFRKMDTPPILLIVDRRDDPVTPLLTQWTYQAMVHELIGIKDGKVDLSDVPDVRPELKVSFFLKWNCLAIDRTVCRRLPFSKIKIHSSRRTCISILATWAKMRKNMSSNMPRNGKATCRWNPLRT